MYPIYIKNSFSSTTLSLLQALVLMSHFGHWMRNQMTNFNYAKVTLVTHHTHVKADEAVPAEHVLTPLGNKK